jgi:hypothetical protein
MPARIINLQMIREFEDYVKIGGVGDLIQNVSSISRFGIRFLVHLQPSIGE